MNKLATLYRDNQVYVFAILTSILLSCLLGYRHSVINPDGICYLLSAEMLGSASLKDVMQLCPQSQWPFYSAMIYVFAQLSHFSYGISAALLNASLSLVSVITFISIVKLLGGNKRVLWLAALVILFDHQFNILRDDVIRDHGFWAFYLISIYLLLKYFREPTWFTALLWGMSLALATLFRIEGAIFLLGMPFVAWFNVQDAWLVRAKHFIRLNFPVLTVCFAYIIWQVLHPHPTQELGRVNEVIHQLQHAIFILGERFQTVQQALIQFVLPIEAIPDAGVAVFVMWIGLYLYNVAITLSCVYTLLVLYACKNRTAIKTTPVIWGYFFFNLALTMIFLAESLFISKRYLIALSLLLMLWVPFAIDDLIQKWSSKRHRVLLSCIALLFFVSALGGVVEFGRSKFFVRSAGTFIAETIPVNAKLYVNDFQLMYYTRHFGANIFKVLPAYLQMDNIIHGQWKQYDYLALRLRKKDNSAIAGLLTELSDIKPVKIFSDMHGNRVAVYKLHKSM